MRIPRAAAWALLLAACAVAVFPDFLSPYSPARQHRDFPYAAPGRYGAADVRWFVRGDPYRWLGVVPASTRLFGAREPDRVFLLGTDEFGRDWYSRLCHGASISLLLAPSAALLSLALAVVLGACAGYRGGFVDAIVMRASEVFVVLPWFYVAVALRAALPLNVSGPTTIDHRVRPAGVTRLCGTGASVPRARPLAEASRVRPRGAGRRGGRPPHPARARAPAPVADAVDAIPAQRSIFSRMTNYPRRLGEPRKMVRTQLANQVAIPLARGAPGIEGCARLPEPPQFQRFEVVQRNTMERLLTICVLFRY